MSTEQVYGRIPYRDFPRPEARRDVFAITSGVSKYLHNLQQATSQPANLLLIDTSARPAWRGVSTYFERKYPKEEKPHIYFINPRGMETNADRTIIQVDYDFTTTYRKLLQEKHAPTLVFDTCIHTSDTMKSVLETLQRTGFTDVKIGIMSNHRNRSDIPFDFIALPDCPRYACHPFYTEDGVHKVPNKPYARPRGARHLQARINQLRAEIRQIITDETQDQQ